MKELQRTVEDYIKSQDDLEFELGDTLDVKTSIALVLITFLATQSADFLRHSPPLSSFWHVLQVVSVVLLVAAGVLAIVELKPRRYKARTGPAEFLAWVEELREHYKGEPDLESRVVDEINRREVEKITSRFNRNRAINAMKSNLIEWCFRFTLAAVLLNLATLARLAMHH
jgi:hypothetical protein